MHSAASLDSARARVARAASRLADAVVGTPVPPARRIVVVRPAQANPETDAARDLGTAAATLRRMSRPNRLEFLRRVAAG